MSLSTLPYHQHTICYDEQKARGNQAILDMVDSLDDTGILSRLDRPTIIVLGGDGTMLQAIRSLAHEARPFLGVNFGTKGFFMNPVEEILTGTTPLVSTQYPMLRGISGEKHFLAFNEIDIEGAEGRMITAKITIDGHSELDLSGDGLIISTPAGSTGYNSALGGPILPHHLRAMILTPKAPWIPRRQPSVILAEETVIEIEIIGRNHLIEIATDGQAHEVLHVSHPIQITQSPESVTLLSCHSEVGLWQTKVLVEQGFQKCKGG